MKKTESELNQIIGDVMGVACPAERVGSQAHLIEQDRKRERAKRYCYRFASHMQSDMPYQSEAEAITALAPVAVWIFGWAARQFAIYVIKLIWNAWHKSPSSVRPATGSQ